MFPLRDDAKRTLGKLRDTINRIVQTYVSKEERQEPVRRTRENEHPPRTEGHGQTLPSPVEARPPIPMEEKKILEAPTEKITGPSYREVSWIGKSLFIKGEIALKEDLTVDGRIEGKIELKDHQLIIGSSGIVHAEIQAKNVTVEGSVVGNISASGMVSIQSTGSLVGDISAARIAINEGAHFKGSVDIIELKAESAKE